MTTNHPTNSSLKNPADFLTILNDPQFQQKFAAQIKAVWSQSPNTNESKTRIVRAYEAIFCDGALATLLETDIYSNISGPLPFRYREFEQSIADIFIDEFLPDHMNLRFEKLKTTISLQMVDNRRKILGPSSPDYEEIDGLTFAADAGSFFSIEAIQGIGRWAGQQELHFYLQGNATPKAFDFAFDYFKPLLKSSLRTLSCSHYSSRIDELKNIGTLEEFMGEDFDYVRFRNEMRRSNAIQYGGDYGPESDSSHIAESAFPVLGKELVFSGFGSRFLSMMLVTNSQVFATKKQKQTLLARFKNAVVLLMYADESPAILSLALSMAAMEALLVESKDGISDALARNFAALVQPNSMARPELISSIKKLYNLRSRGLHGEELDAPTKLAVNARIAASITMRAIVEWGSHVEKMGEAAERTDFFQELESSVVTGNRFVGVQISDDDLAILLK